MPKKEESPKKEKASPKKIASPKKSTKEKKAQKPAAKSLRVHTIAEGLPKRLVPAERKRKISQPERFDEPLKAEKEKKEVSIPKGKGKKFEDCPNIAAQLKKRTLDNELLATIHTLILGRGPKKERRSNLLEFKGIVYEDNKDREFWENRGRALRKSVLQDICALFGIEPKGSRDELVPKLVDFLEKPSDSEAKYPVSDEKSLSRRKRTRSSSRDGRTKKKAKKDPNAPKRSISAYFYFMKDQRKDFEKKFKSDSNTQLVTRMAKEWAKLSADEKGPYNKLAKKDKKRYDQEKKAYKKSKDEE